MSDQASLLREVLSGPDDAARAGAPARRYAVASRTLHDLQVGFAVRVLTFPQYPPITRPHWPTAPMLQTRTRNHRIDSVVRRHVARSFPSTGSSRNRQLSQVLRSRAVLHGGHRLIRAVFAPSKLDTS